jgi:hypothetical protein
VQARSNIIPEVTNGRSSNDQIGVRVTNASEPASQEIYHDVWEALVEKSSTTPQLFFPRKGDALIWAANLLHGGSRQRDPNATRWSQVTHYFFENCCYITPMLSDVFIGKLRVRDLTDIATGAKVPNIYIDAKLLELETSQRQPQPSQVETPQPQPQPPPRRLKQLLRDPVTTAKKVVARLGGFATH